MKTLAEVLARLAELERRVDGSQRHGVVHEVDPGAGTVRLRLGEGTDGEPFLSPPIPYAQTMGALKAHVPPSVGQQMTMMAPGGDWQQAVAMGLSASDANQSPSGAGDQNVITFGGATITLKGDALVIAVGGVSLTVSGGGLAVTGGQITHNGVNIGDDHEHRGVVPGGGRSGPPVS